MSTPQEQRKIRLKNDYAEMQNIQGTIVQWIPTNGVPPYVEEYKLTVKVRTIIGPGPTYRDLHIIKVSLPPSYPLGSPPQIVMETSPQPFHPNWFTDRRWCYGSWVISEGLGHHIIRMIRTLQFDSEITNPDSSANYVAKNWYLENQHRNWFPCDRQILPDPTMERFGFELHKKTFRIDS